MVRLSPDQQDRLVAVTDSKTHYDKEKVKLDAWYQAQLEALKTPIRQAVMAAGNAGVPIRRIHIDGLGFAQVSSMMNFLEDKRKSLGERIANLAPSETPAQTLAGVEEKAISSVWQEFAPNEYTVNDAETGQVFNVSVGEPEEGVTIAVVEGVSADEWPEWLDEAITEHLPGALHGYEEYLSE